MDLNQMTRLCQDYTRVEKAIEYIEARREEQPSLASIARAADLSQFHFQKLFSRWVGISPKRFLQYLTKEHAKTLLDRSENILAATYGSGLSSPGRLHDLFMTCEAMSPGAYKTKGQGLKITFGYAPTPFGTCLLAWTGQGVCSLKFLRQDTEATLADWLKRTWPRADLDRDDREALDLALKIFAPGIPDRPAPVHLFVQGTNFQIKVWEALVQIPLGHTVTYEDVARHIGLPRATRAVGTAVGKNPIPYLIPCHRVIRKTGIFGHYGEGPARKKALLAWESAKTGTGQGQ